MYSNISGWYENGVQFSCDEQESKSKSTANKYKLYIIFINYKYIPYNGCYCETYIFVKICIQWSRKIHFYH